MLNYTKSGYTLIKMAPQILVAQNEMRRNFVGQLKFVAGGLEQ